MKIVMHNTQVTIGLGVLEPSDEFKPLVIVDRYLLKELAELTLRGQIEKCGHVPGVYGRPITQYRCRRGFV